MEGLEPAPEPALAFEQLELFQENDKENLNIDVLNSDNEIENRFTAYSCPCYSGKYPSIIDLLINFDMNGYAMEQRVMYIDKCGTFCDTCKDIRSNWDLFLEYRLPDFYRYIEEIKNLIKNNPEAFFTNIPTLNISPVKYVKILDAYAKSVDPSSPYVKYDEYVLSRCISNSLYEIKTYAEEEVIKHTAFAYISNTSNDLILKLPMEIWRYIFDFI